MVQATKPVASDLGPQKKQVASDRSHTKKTSGFILKSLLVVGWF